MRMAALARIAAFEQRQRDMARRVRLYRAMAVRREARADHARRLDDLSTSVAPDATGALPLAIVALIDLADGVLDADAEPSAGYDCGDPSPGYDLGEAEHDTLDLAFAFDGNPYPEAMFGEPPIAAPQASVAAAEARAATGQGRSIFRLLRSPHVVGEAELADDGR
jgi:hypothetical protein